MKLPLWRIAEFTGAKGEFDQELMAVGYSIDSRTVNAGDLFIALPGERFDGHDYVRDALDKGAVAAIVHAGRAIHADARLLRVDDTLQALQSLGAAARRLWGKPLLAVTGSVGKTTTKEILAHILGTRFRVMKSVGNLNNHIGLPLQLLKLEPEHDLAVVEMGMNHAGEIRKLGVLAHHDMAVVTVIAPVHLEFFASLAEIARAKYEVIETLHPGGVSVLNADDEYVSQFGRDFKGKVVTFGIHRAADVSAQKITVNGVAGSQFELVVAGSMREPAMLPLVGAHNIYNALAATAAAMERGISPSEAVRALATMVAGDKRGEVFSLAGATIINDCYNSNPSALKAMIDTLASMKADRRVLVAGEMLELGSTAEALHRECGRHAAEKKIDVVVGVRGLAQGLADAACSAGVQSQFLETPEEAGQWLARQVRPGDAVLLKASRGVKLERALEVLKEKLSS
jgi:UDP-N-acetylmuramoyl-tripeptide--D-alanyl-D-alanine ligase